METFYYNSPIGILQIDIENDEIISSKIVDKIKNCTTKTKFIENIKTQLDEYFSHKRKSFDLKLNPQGTDFQKSVWCELQKIPYGKTKSYSQISQNLGNKNAQRAVGNACNKNPIMLFIPCHRVIAQNGNLSGFAFGVNIKEILLKLENYNLKD